MKKIYQTYQIKMFFWILRNIMKRNNQELRNNVMMVKQNQ